MKYVCVALRRHDVVQREVKDLEKGIAHLHNCMARYNALIADNADLKVQLVNDNFHLETKIGHELQVLLTSFVTASLSLCPYTQLLHSVYRMRCSRDGQCRQLRVGERVFATQSMAWCPGGLVECAIGRCQCVLHVSQ